MKQLQVTIEFITDWEALHPVRPYTGTMWKASHRTRTLLARKSS